MTERDTVRHPTCALQENKASDNQHRMPVELSQTTVPAQTLLEVKNPSQHEDDGDEARSSGSTQSQHQVLQVLHLCGKQLLLLHLHRLKLQSLQEEAWSRDQLLRKRGRRVRSGVWQAILT